jgi:parallel beta-helix repeat protein
MKDIKKYKKILLVIGFLVILNLFMGTVSADSMNLTDTELAATGVKNYTASTGHLPNYVDVSDKNSTMPSFLNTLTTYTVHLNQNVTTPVTKVSVSNPTGPSGSASGTLQKSQYITVANNINSFISSNGRAPNYASSSLGNIRYESLVYMFSRIIDYYRINNQLPSSITVTNIAGVDSAGVIIDNVPPTVSNNLASGSYNTVKNVTLTATDNFDTNPKVYYSLDNGTTWNNQVKTVTLSLNQGVTNLKYYGFDASGNAGITQIATYTIDTTIPNINIEELESAASAVQSYIEDNHQLPTNVTINGTTVDMAQFLRLISTALVNINNNITISIPPESCAAAPSPSENITTSGNLNKTDYLNLANSTKSYIDSNKQAPNYQTTNLGNMSYESLIYTFAQILRSYQVANVLPNYIIVRPWTSIVANNTTAFITMDQINNAADTVQSYIETNHQLPDHVTILGSKVTMPQFLKLETTYLTNANNNLYQSIPLGNYGTAPNPSESITGGDLNSTDYLSIASDIITFMDSNGRVPNYKPSVRGSIRYESLVYIYAEIINSASKNKRLPDYLTLTPWTTVSNNNTVFITMDQINTAVWTVKSYVEINHALPSSVNISGRQVTMPQFLKLEIISLKNINVALYQSIVLQTYETAPSPSETLTSGKINRDNYLNAVATIKSYMDSNGRAPNYAWTSQGNMRYEGLIYMYSQILNYYNVKNTLPEYVTVHPWSIISNPNTVSFNPSQVISVAETVKSYVEINHALPSSVTISGTVVTMPQFLKLLTTTLHNIKGDYTGQLVLESYGLPTDYSETITGGTLNETQYLDLAKSVEYFMYDGRAPNYQNSSLGNIRYDSLIYMFSQILSSYKANSYTLPDLITVRPWSVVSNTNTLFITTDQLKNASKTVKSYIEINHMLPSSVNIAGTSVSMPQFLKLLTTSLSNINGKLNATIVLQNYNSGTNPSETTTGGTLNSTAYLNLANNIISYMDTNGKAPDNQNTLLGNIRYESLVYMYSSILDYYGNKTQLPQNIIVTPWAVVSNTSTSFFTPDQIESAAKTVQSYVETNHQLPANVTVSGNQLSMSQFLQLATTTLLNIDGSTYAPIMLKNYNASTNPSETITTTGTITGTDYINLANDIVSYMRVNGKSPDYRTITMGNIRFESLVYIYSQILSSHNTTGTLPEFITLTPWSIVSNTSTVFITTDQLKNASETVKSYVETNHMLPSSVNISGRQVTMPQFLKISVKVLINIESYLNTSVILDDVGDPSNPTENINRGTILNDEFVDMANYIKSYMDSHGTAPNNVTDTSLGDTMRYESLVYMFSKILTSYNATENAPDEVSVTPWLAMSNPNGTFNFRTQKVFNSIQEAIDDTDTISGDTIWLKKSTYSENVVINKKVIIKPISGFNVTVQALNPNIPVFTINFSGNGTTIQDLILNGCNNNACIYINNSNENQILGNNITSNSNGIYIYNSKENIISGNEISNNSAHGVLITAGSDNEVSSNKLTSNGFAGISIENSDKNRVYSNIISINQDGICLNNSSAEIHLNQIVGNTRYGLYNQGNGTVNATNNWWGSNNPIISSNSSSDVCIAGGTVTYDPWLILSINSSTDRSDRNGTYYNYQLTADLTHNNQGGDTSSDGNIPDDIPINFNSTLGTINASGTTKKGKAELKLTSSSAGMANVSVTLDNQTVSQAVNITNVNVLGVYNTRTQESFSSIQEAVDDPDTINGDTITIEEGIYIENVAINKQLIIKPVTGANVTVKAKNEEKSVFVLNNEGSGSTIQGFNIISSIDSYGVSLSHVFNSNIGNNTISNSNRGIYLYLSGNNSLTGNILTDCYYGLVFYNSSSNSITGNTIKNNENGLYLFNSNYNKINGNILSENYYGSYFYHSSNNNATGNNITSNWVGVYLYDTNNNLVTSNNFINNGAGITYHNSIGTSISGNNFTNNWLADWSVIDSGEMVLATTIYTCGPAALATILKNQGIYTTEGELAKLAGTDETGTSLYGLKTAAQSKGLTAVGVRLTLEQIQHNYLVVLNIDGTNHFEIVLNISNTTVYLFDPNLGNIEMPLEKFNELYTGIALIINGQTPINATILTDDEMRNIKAKYHTEKIPHTYMTPGFYYPTVKWVTRSFSYPTLKFKWVPTHYLWGWIPIPGHFEAQIVWKKFSYHYPIIVWKYHPGHPITYYTYKSVFEKGDQLNDKKVSTLLTSGFGMVTSLKFIETGVAAIGGTEGLGTPVGVGLIVIGGVGFSMSASAFVNALDDPWFINVNDPDLWRASPLTT